MGKIALLVIAASLLAGCASNPVPEGYTGPLAHIVDSVTSHGSSSADFFYVANVNGRKIGESLSATNQANYGQGLRMKPVIIGRDVPAELSTFTIVGRTHYAAPIIELTHTVYRVSGDITFTPQPNRSYLVKGVLGPNYSAVWIEDSETGAVIDRKVEVTGSTALGMFEK